MSQQNPSIRPSNIDAFNAANKVRTEFGMSWNEYLEFSAKIIRVAKEKEKEIMQEREKEIRELQEKREAERNQRLNSAIEDAIEWVPDKAQLS